MKHRCSIVVVLCVLWVSVHLSGCGVVFVIGPEETEEIHETYPIEPGTRIEVYNRNGNIHIRTWDRAYVEVYALKKTRDGRSELRKARVQVTLNDEMVIQTRYTESKVDVSVDYEIRLPIHAIVDDVDTSNGNIVLEGTQGDAILTTSNGRIDIQGMDGYVHATTSNGSIYITGVTGILKAQTSNGSIQAEIPDMRDEDTSITTTNGSITLHVSDGVSADIELRTSNGRIRVHDLPIDIRESSSTYIGGELGNGGRRIYVKTSNGNIDVYTL